MKKKIYISGAITGTKDYMKRFEEAERKVASEYEATVINPARINSQIEGLTHEEYMRISLAQLSCCDAIYMLGGWRESRGASMEYGYAVGAGLRIIEEGKEGAK